MPLVSPVPAVPYRQFNEDGHPLAGGQFFAFAAGTDTPQATYHDPAGTVQNPHPVILDDSGYSDIYLLSGQSYKLVQNDATGVQQWLADQVVAPGPGGAATSSPIVVHAVSGASQLVAPAAWQPGWRQIGVTARVTQAFGTSQGLTQLAIGDAVQFDRWGNCDVSLHSTTDASDFLTGDSPWTAQAMDLIITGIGGAFDAVGQVELVLHYAVL